MRFNRANCVATPLSAPAPPRKLSRNEASPWNHYGTASTISLVCQVSQRQAGGMGRGVNAGVVCFSKMDFRQSSIISRLGGANWCRETRKQRHILCIQCLGWGCTSQPPRFVGRNSVRVFSGDPRLPTPESAAREETRPNAGCQSCAAAVSRSTYVAITDIPPSSECSATQPSHWQNLGFDRAARFIFPKNRDDA